ncbi:MAG: hypothetical protein HFK07_05220 [Clostridia bacterium]|nr:hypothetical protein [Clostridia bacterium]MCX4367182.1 hypothetical protein [Clostridia bacterium]
MNNNFCSLLTLILLASSCGCNSTCNCQDSLRDNDCNCCSNNNNLCTLLLLFALCPNIFSNGCGCCSNNC